MASTNESGEGARTEEVPGRENGCQGGMISLRIKVYARRKHAGWRPSTQVRLGKGDRSVDCRSHRR
ncbi:hypothetical protein [Actinophytocola sp.]|uniref:hypothetical protein n=1 Tax=Actinophytocola sp. TaxID=1872138 RepID=UPI003D6C14D9